MRFQLLVRRHKAKDEFPGLSGDDLILCAVTKVLFYWENARVISVIEGGVLVEADASPPKEVPAWMQVKEVT